MHGLQWLNSHPVSQQWQDHYEPVAQRDVPGSEQTVQTLRSALAIAQQRLRDQNDELQRLREAIANGHHNNQYLVAEIQQVKRQLRREREARHLLESREQAHQSQAYGNIPWHDDDIRDDLFPSTVLNIPSPRSLPRPFNERRAGASYEPGRLGGEIRVEAGIDANDTQLLDLPYDVPTFGSVGHPDTCKPCFYIFNKKGCHFGRSCLYCHMEHVKRKKERPPKLVRQECREIANQVFRDAASASSSGTASLNLEEALRSRVELVRASQVTTNYAASVLRALGRNVAGQDAAREGERDEPYADDAS